MNKSGSRYWTIGALALALAACGGGGGGGGNGGSGSPSGDAGNGGGDGGGTEARVPAGVYFAADDGVSGSELWRTDATTAGTTRIADINPGAGNSSPQKFVELGDTLMFLATTSTTGYEWHRTDGTEAGTELVIDLLPGANSGVQASDSQVARVGDRIFFLGRDTTANAELWVTDGTAGGTRLVRDIDGDVDNSSDPDDFAVLGDRLLFTADDGSTGTELWISDGTEAGTVRLADIFDGAISSRVYGLTTIGDRVYFGAEGDGPDQDLEPWITDGTTAGTQRIANIGPSEATPDLWTGFDGRVFFSASDATAGQFDPELWATDGTSAGTAKVAETNVNGQGKPTSLTVFDGRLFFAANDDDGDRELWASDGTTAGTTRLANIGDGPFDGSPAGLTVVGETLFMAASGSQTVGQQLWKSDGTEAGTMQVRQINPATSAQLDQLTAYDGRLLFRADDGSNGRELWVSDGTEAGTRLLLDIDPGGEGLPQNLFAVQP